MKKKDPMMLCFPQEGKRKGSETSYYFIFLSQSEGKQEIKLKA